MQIVHSFEIFSAIDRPGHRVERYLQFFFNFLQKIETVLSITVHLVDEYNHRCVPHAAHFHQPAGLRFYSIYAVHYQNNTINRR